ncbi:MAG: RDD family protein [Promethearchaeota archaeon]
MSLKFCPKCGNELEPNSSFCDSCGADLKTRTVVTQTVEEKKVEPAIKMAPETVIYGDFFPRLAAVILDGIIIGIIGSILSWIIFVPWVPFNVFDPFGGWWYVSFPFNWVIGFLYMWLLETYNNGQTFGKMALNLRTVDEETLTLASSSSYAVNNLLKPSGFLILDFIIGILMNSGDPKHRLRLMQNISKTVVISTK